jgi:hypothetical protein
MKAGKQEIHALPTLVGSLVTKLDMILSRDGNFIADCDGKGKRDIHFTVSEKHGWTTFVTIKPRWWPDDVKLLLCINNIEQNKRKVVLVKLEIPQLAKKRAAQYEVGLDFVEEPPYFRKNKSIGNQECAERFNDLCMLLYKAAAI